MIQINLRVTGMSRLGAALHDLLNPNLGIDPKQPSRAFCDEVDTGWSEKCGRNRALDRQHTR